MYIKYKEYILYKEYIMLINITLLYIRNHINTVEKKQMPFSYVKH